MAVGHPATAIGPKMPLKRLWVSPYVNGFTMRRKITAEKSVICHFSELEAIILYYNILFYIKYISAKIANIMGICHVENPDL
jgi:hypothetical protein